MSKCGGRVSSLVGQRVAFTGRIYLNDEFTTHHECGALLKKRRGTWSKKYSNQVSMVVVGRLPPSGIIDPEEMQTWKLKLASESSRGGEHVHVVDADGFARLLSSRPAPCLVVQKTRRGWVIKKQESEIFGGPIRHHKTTGHGGKTFSTDMDALDRGTEGHEKTLRLLEAVLRAKDIVLQHPGKGWPLFDAGWNGTRNKFIVAEVKSLGGNANETQQIRLGLGQVLDYAHECKAMGKTVQPVVVLERKPIDDKWNAVCKTAGVALLFGPNFDGAVLM